MINPSLVNTNDEAYENDNKTKKYKILRVENNTKKKKLYENWR